MPSTHSDALHALAARLVMLATDLDVPVKRERLEELKHAASEPDLWDDPTRARAVTTELSRIETDVTTFDRLQARIDDLIVLDELAGEENDPDTLTEVAEAMTAIGDELSRLDVLTMLSGEYDTSDALVSVHAGEGGVDAMDWAQMLQRMYLRWAESHGFETQMYDESYGEEAGIKSATFEIRGVNVYGWLNVEHGVHRLVRISPFDAAARRQTSFALVDVVPVLPDVDEDVTIADDELRVDVYRSSGPGGQSVNTTDSAVRLTHLPTGVVVSCQNEKSQHQNKAAALRVMKMKLAELERQKRDDELSELRGGVQNVGFGSQIRSYVLHPYQMVKDLRSEYETGNVQAVLDGSIDALLEAELRRRVRGNEPA
jgi:peptide chain release factor 2